MQIHHTFQLQTTVEPGVNRIRNIHATIRDASDSVQISMASTGKVLFELPIAATNGNVVCTEPAPQVYLITFTSPPDNRLLTVSIGLAVSNLPMIQC